MGDRKGAAMDAEITSPARLIACFFAEMPASSTVTAFSPAQIRNQMTRKRLNIRRT